MASLVVERARARSRKPLTALLMVIRSARQHKSNSTAAE